jgi:hypothetical protein
LYDIASSHTFGTELIGYGSLVFFTLKVTHSTLT